MYAETQFYKTICSQAEEDKWKAERWNGVSASVVASIMGLNPYDKRKNRNYEEIVQEYATKESNFRGNAYTEAGQYFEASIFRWAHEKGCVDYPIYSWGQLLQSKVWPWLMATPDGYMITDQVRGYESHTLVECKLTGKPWSSGAPLHYQIQLQTQYAVTGLEKGCILVHWHGNRPLPLWYQRDDRLIAQIVKVTKQFWADVEEQREALKGKDNDSDSKTGAAG